MVVEIIPEQTKEDRLERARYKRASFHNYSIHYWKTESVHYSTVA